MDKNDFFTILFTILKKIKDDKQIDTKVNNLKFLISLKSSVCLKN
jgi:hypothetical protein